MSNIVNFLNDRSGAAAIQYVLVAALIATVMLGSANTLGAKIDINAKMNSEATTLAGALSSMRADGDHPVGRSSPGPVPLYVFVDQAAVEQ